MRAVAAGLAVGVLAAGCSAGSGSPKSEGPGSCAADKCAEQVAAYAERVATVPGVEGVAEFVYVSEQATDGAHVVGELRLSSGATCASMAEPIGRALWESTVDPVSYVRLQCYVPGTSGADYETVRFSFSLQQEALTEKWGTRPS